MTKIEKIKKIIVCPNCQGELYYNQNQVYCSNCQFNSIATDERIDLFEYESYQSDEKDSLVFKVKSILKRYPAFYKFLLYAVGPPQVSISAKQFIKKYSSADVILNIGAGSKFIRPDVIDVDIYPYKNVTLLADALNLPIQNSSVDAVICESLVEHVREPEKLIAEINRILKPGGQVYLVAPFMLGFHSSPNDFYRWTDQGLLLLFNKFQDVKVLAFYGPTSALTFLFGEWLAILFSFNIKFIYNFWILVSMVMQVLLKPLQIIDYLLVHYHYIKNISYGFTVIASKK